MKNIFSLLSALATLSTSQNGLKYVSDFSYRSIFGYFKLDSFYTYPNAYTMQGVRQFIQTLQTVYVLL